MIKASTGSPPIFIFMGTALLAFLFQGNASAEISYNRDVRPILSDKCFYCHGPDEGHRKADLRLDSEEGASMDLGGHQAIVPGSLEKSEVWKRIMTQEEADLMPPPESEKHLNATEKEIIRQWIEQGAKYERHWSLIPPDRNHLPGIKGKDWIRNPIDAFVLARLEEEGLSPSPEASPETLIRRVTLDLTGLPPTPAEVDAFLADPSEEAWERVVDRLLDSPRYGEHMTLDWLNAARYADTNGYQNDQERQMWRWRDWVIKAFNDNKPFDQFTIEQLAGDMLPDATLEQRIASGFNRNHRINGEGGVIPEEYRVEYVVDRVETTGTVWLGLTLGCARCHSHKFDPITQREFFQLFSYFNNVQENGRDGNKGNAVPMISVPIEEMQPRVERAERELRELQSRLAANSPAFLEDLEAWRKRTSEQVRKAESEPAWRAANVTKAKSTGKVLLTPLEDSSFLATGANPPKATYTFTIEPGEGEVTAVRLETLTHPSMTNTGLSRSVNGNFVLTAFEILEHRTGMNEPRMLKIASAEADYSQKGYPVANAIDGKNSSGWAIFGRKKMVDTTAMFLLEEPLKADSETSLIIRLRHDSQSQAHTVGRVRLSLSSLQKPTLDGKEGIPASIVAALGAKDQKQKDRLADYYRELSPVYAPLRKSIAAQRKELDRLRKESTTSVMVMQEMAEPRQAYLLKRGQYDQPGEEVSPGIPVSLGSLPKGVPNNRLGFARWLVDPTNPLSARVTVNRYWQRYFGTGLVKTVDDFGAQGEFPSHPGLLDWLATEFISTGWNIKAMQKLIVTSATYRQSSAMTPELIERDPDNRLLARGPRFRLRGSAIRDQALAIAGLLKEHLGGPSVKPYQPKGLWEEVGGRQGLSYKQGEGQDLYRRSMYTFWKRTVAPPTLNIFDAGGRERCDVARRATNTPLQALATLNDVQFVEAARFLGQRMMMEGGDSVRDRLAHGWRLALAREPDEKELTTLEKGFHRHLGIYRDNPSAAEEIRSIGDSEAAQVDSSEHAAYTVIANLILNLDETITRE